MVIKKPGLNHKSSDPEGSCVRKANGADPICTVVCVCVCVTASDVNIHTQNSNTNVDPDVNVQSNSASVFKFHECQFAS